MPRLAWTRRKSPFWRPSSFAGQVRLFPPGIILDNFFFSAPPLPGLASGQISATTALARHSHALWPSQPARQALLIHVHHGIVTGLSLAYLLLFCIFTFEKGASANISTFHTGFSFHEIFPFNQSFHLKQRRVCLNFPISHRLVNMLLLLRHLAEVPASVMVIQVQRHKHKNTRSWLLHKYVFSRSQVMQAPLERVTNMVERIALGVL